MTNTDELEPGWYWVKMHPWQTEPEPARLHPQYGWRFVGVKRWHEAGGAVPAIIGPRLTPPTEGGDNGWLPMEMAPKDGTEVLLLSSGLRTIGHYTGPDARGFVWHCLDGDRHNERYVTHWQPLPPPPTEGKPHG